MIIVLKLQSMNFKQAAGLARTDIVEYLLQVSPSSAKVQDFTGKTPLHWAASAKNNERCFNLLTHAGCDEAAIDNVCFMQK